ncbi:hypothetical protein Q5H92_11640 [Hymenobacter sp. M29]|uniref:Outer membrane protein beta-barrel domain-containing protein n=1 Tax=Hymenobacter mellowenesis TaxID=3063995 RepID=A0ABT9AB00_9BACT|nr:outer membrane beta-barrel protein [Hymenobacter sp. M29]MDO7847013.1 hypothetical protein [Hymenobacter sp. M29]
MNKSLLFAGCGLFGGLLAAPVQAQTNFAPGYVLPATGDTLRGEVDLREGRLSARRCRFRPTASADVITYEPQQVRGYGFSAPQRHYRTMAVAVDETAAQQPVFLEVLVDGPASLYFLRDGEKRDEYFVGLANQPLALLRHGMVQVSRNGETSTAMDTGYRNTLRAALADCPAVEKKLSTLLFQESALLNVVTTYNADCRGYRAARARQSTAAAVHLTVGLLLGAARHTVAYEGFPFGGGAVTKNTSTGLAIGPVFQFSSARVSQRVSLVASLLYEPEKYEISPGPGSQMSPNARIHFDFAYLRLPLMVRYTYPRGKVVPLAEAGLTVAYALKTDVSSGIIANGQYTAYPGPITDIVKGACTSVQIGYGAGVGVGTHAMGGRAVALLLRAERTNGFTDAADVRTSTVHLYGLFTIDLTK